jgi:hypothetical protein
MERKAAGGEPNNPFAQQNRFTSGKGSSEARPRHLDRATPRGVDRRGSEQLSSEIRSPICEGPDPRLGGGREPRGDRKTWIGELPVERRTAPETISIDPPFCRTPFAVFVSLITPTECSHGMCNAQSRFAKNSFPHSLPAANSVGGMRALREAWTYTGVLGAAMSTRPRQIDSGGGWEQVPGSYGHEASARCCLGKLEKRLRMAMSRNHRPGPGPGILMGAFGRE